MNNFEIMIVRGWEKEGFKRQVFDNITRIYFSHPLADFFKFLLVS